MNFPLMLRSLFLVPTIAGAVVLSGCGNEGNTPEAQTAEQAVGVKPESETSKTVTIKRDVVVTEEKKVTDPKTGELLSDTTKTTPVTITQEKEVKTNVKVDVGDTKTSGSPQKK